MRDHKSTDSPRPRLTTMQGGPEPEISGAIFDLDGTILDSMPIWKDFGEDFLKSKGIPPPPGLTERLKIMSLWQAACYYCEQYGIHQNAFAILQEMNERIWRRYRDEAKPKEGVPEFLRTLHRVKIPMCIATASDLPLAEMALRRWGLRKYIRNIITCTQVGRGKDEPHIFLAARETLGTPAQTTWVFEDSLHAIGTAKSQGFPVAGVYDSYEPRQDEVESASDLYIRSFREIALVR